MKAWILILSLVGIVKGEQKCYGNLGCYQNFKDLKALPQGPDVIKTQFLLYTRQKRTTATSIPAVDESHWDSLLKSGHFTPSKPTKIIIHGFINSGNTQWVHTMRDALLTKGDFNVIAVDWGHGSQLPFTQATANTFLVSAQVARFLNHLHSKSHVDLKSVHLIGHSLGAQISGNTGSAVRGLGRITGLDPAEPYFIDFRDSLRLDKSDADFVDVIHTDGEKFNYVSGFGLMKASGDVDFYPNGGQDQPGCADDPVGSALGSLLGGHFGQIGNKVSCSHGRAHQYFTESIHAGTCHFSGHTCRNWDTYETGTCHGCPSGGCPVMGYDADKTSARGSFYLSTVQKSPFCGHEFFVEVDLASVAEDVFGRLYVTLVGSKGKSEELEFTRQDRHYHKADQEKHMVATHQDIGTVNEVKVNFVRGSGLAALGTDTEIIISRVGVLDANTSQKETFCVHNGHIQDGNAITLKNTGC